MSGIRYVLDTNIVIGLLKGHAEVLELAERCSLDLALAGVSQITRMELLSYPSLSEDEELAIREFLRHCRICLLDEAIESEAILLRKTSLLKLPDAIIAATAKVHQAQLLSLDKALSKTPQSVPN